MSSEDNLIDEIQEICDCIQSPERIIRQNCLKKFQSTIQTLKSEDDQLVKYFELTYLYLLKCYSDKYEICRSLSCFIINDFIDKLPDNGFYLECIVPIIAKRLGQSETIEDSEEMRLELIKQVYSLVIKYRAVEPNDDRLFKSYNNLIDILLKTLRDEFPAIQRESCNVILVMSGEKCFHYRAEVLVNPLIGMLHHRHFSNRIAAIEALSHVVLNIYTNGECIMRVLTEISPLLMDSMAYVRRECGRTGCMLLLKLRDRYSFFDKLIPLVLCCLADENEEVAVDIKHKWVKCGEQYYNENENELSKLLLIDNDFEYCLDGIERPTLGCRAIAQRCLRVINVILYEMEEWKEEVRLHSLKLFFQVILHCEKSLTALFMDIYPVLSKTCMDECSSVATEATKSALLLGNLLTYKDWIQHAIDDFKKFSNLGYLICFTHLYIGADQSKYDDIKKILEMIVESKMALSNKKTVQKELLYFMNILFDDFKLIEITIPNDVELIEKYVYQNVINVIAASVDESPSNVEDGTNILSKMNNQGLSYLHKKYLGDMIDNIEGIDSLNSKDSEPIILLNGYLRYCGIQMSYISSIQKAIKLVLDNSQPDGKIRILTATSIAMLSWNGNSQCSLDVSIERLERFIEGIIIPSLTWQVGRSAESIRSMATACLCSISENATEEAFVIFPKIIKYFAPLVEDNNIATRQYALRSLLGCGPIDSKDIKEIGIAVTARLDDPSSEVRELAALTLGKLSIKKIENQNIDNWKTLFNHIFAISIHHLEDPDVRLKNVLHVSLKKLALQNKDIFTELMENPKFSKFSSLEKIKSELVID